MIGIEEQAGNASQLPFGRSSSAPPRPEKAALPHRSHKEDMSKLVLAITFARRDERGGVEAGRTDSMRPP